MKNNKTKYKIIGLILLAFIGLRLLVITDCSPARGFFDFGKSDDGIERMCGLSSDNAWMER